jgi:two-component sensor histidine kinase
LTRLITERSDLGPADVDLLSAVVREWSLVADLALSDLVLWVPTWNDGGLVAVAQVRPTTAPTSVPVDVVGTFVPRGRHPHLDQAAAFARPVTSRDPSRPGAPAGVEAYPILVGDRVIGILARHATDAPRVAGQLEDVYLSSADDLLAMLVDGNFPHVDAADDDAASAPRVGDGIIRLTADGVVVYASPNAVSALRRLGLATDVVGHPLAQLAMRLSHRPGPMDAALSAIAAGRVPGRADIENPTATVLLRGIPVVRDGERVGAIVFCQDVTDLRRRERALISKDATIREIHHRVKNNLQTVAAMLRLQARRAGTEEARSALEEAELRVAAIAVVHESLSLDAGESVDVDEVVDRIIGLVRDLAPAHAPTGQVPSITREGGWGPLPSDLVTPLAMATSELLHNAVEHARASAIEVTLARAGSDLVLVVNDDGIGLPEDFVADGAGLGLSIVATLVTSDLHGHYAIEGLPGRGTTATIRVPAPH